MAGIYPNPEDGGIDPGVTVPVSYDPTVDPVGTLAKYFSANCGVVLRPETLNAIISQLSAAIDAAGIAYKMGSGHTDLATAVQYYIQLNMGAYAKATQGPTHLIAQGTPPFYQYRPGQILWLQAPADFAVASDADLAMDGLPPKRIVRTDGSAVVLGDILPNMITGLAYRGDLDAWQMVTGGTDIMALLRARLPIYPQVFDPGGTGKMGAYSTATGTVFIPGSIPFMHRGVFLDNTSNYDDAERTFTTTINQNYHLRWNPIKKFYLVSLTDPAYNPGNAPEYSTGFDSMFDDMLIAWVGANAANALTVTNVSNFYTYKWQISRGGTVGAATTTTFNYQMARTPVWSLDGIAPPGGGRDTDYNVAVQSVTRWATTVYAFTWHDDPPRYGSAGYTIGLTLPPGS